jgi:hypothetical protein
MSESEPRKKQLEELSRARASLVTLGAALIVLVVGLGLRIMANEWAWMRDNHTSIAALARELSSLFIVTVAVTLVWELAAKRAFVDELIAKARHELTGIIAETRVAEEVRAAGLKVFTKDFWNGIDWLSLFKDANTVDLFFAYARSWVGAYTPQLQELARRKDVRIRVVLPNPQNPATISELARRFNKKPDEVRTDIEDTITDLFNIFVEPFRDRADKIPANFSLYFCSKAPVFTFYRFDKLAVMALYKHLFGKGGIPVFVVEKGGSLYDFIVQEMHGFVDPNGGTATRVYPAAVVTRDDNRK